ncbi:alpha/beta hydrolase-fold protein [Peribacillus sp. FSL H8-0477]|uniref:alpha/beta hydrolase n=1 Tax=Peribacillus sp. FSL H8-0477 TaxID=2921388 RepID=UPI0030F729E2
MSKKIGFAFMIVMIIISAIFTSDFTVHAKNHGKSMTVVNNLTSYQLTHDSTRNNDQLTYKVYLPKGYDKHRKKAYPVIYLLHGSNGNENSYDDFWKTLDKMIQKKTIEPVIAIVPSTGNSYWVDSEKYGHYESAVIKDLIPAIDKKYHTIANRSGRYLTGYSMGGYGALRYSLVYPELFSGTALLSPAIQNQEPPETSGAVQRGSFGDPFDLDLWNAKNYPTAIDSYVLQPYRVPIYIATGDDDWNHLSEKEELPSDAAKYNLEVQAVQLYQELHRKNLFQVDFPKWGDVPSSPAELRIMDGGHGKEVWHQGFEEGVKYLFDKKGSEQSASVYDPKQYQTKKNGKVTTETFTASSLVNDSTPGLDQLTYNMYLPPGYNKKNKYPVVYLLHGSSGNAESWNSFWPIMDKMIEQKKTRPFIAIAPITGNSYWVNSHKYGAVESAIINDLIPKIEKEHSTIASREGRGLIGFSMGGYGALRYSLTYPDLFAGTTLLSPAIQDKVAPATSGAVERGSFGEPFDSKVWDELNYPAALKQYSKQPNQVPIFIVTGDDDWNHLSEQEDLPEDANKYNMEVQAVNLYQALHRSNLYNKDFEKWADVPGSPAELRILNGGHGMSVWAEGFEKGLQYMFKNGLGKTK